MILNILWSCEKVNNVNDIEKLYRKFIANKVEPHELLVFIKIYS